MSIKPANMFVTPDSMKDLEDRIESFSGGEKAAAWMGAMMAWNLACKLVEQGEESSDE
jgi:hypothetical protein